jgi:hypothetical protein
MNTQENNMQPGRENYLRKTCITTSKMRTKDKKIKLSTTGIRKYLGNMMPISDRKNPEFD